MSQIFSFTGSEASGGAFRWEGGAVKDEGCDRSPEGVACCAESRKDPSMAGQVICFVSDLCWGVEVGTGQLSQLWGAEESGGMWRWRKGST